MSCRFTEFCYLIVAGTSFNARQPGHIKATRLRRVGSPTVPDEVLLGDNLLRMSVCVFVRKCVYVCGVGRGEPYYGGTPAWVSGVSSYMGLPATLGRAENLLW